MTLFSNRKILPSLIFAMGILCSALAASVLAKDGWLLLAAPLILSIATLLADHSSRWMIRARAGGSCGGWICAGTTLLIGLMLVQQDPHLLRMLLPDLGIASWAFLVLPRVNALPPC